LITRNRAWNEENKQLIKNRKTDNKRLAGIIYLSQSEVEVIASQPI
jgi:hypothetical protein